MPLTVIKWPSSAPLTSLTAMPGAFFWFAAAVRGLRYKWLRVSCGRLGRGLLAPGEGWWEEILVALSFFLVEKISLTTLSADDVQDFIFN